MKITFINTSSFDANLLNPHNATAMSCFSRILRRFLCSGSLRTHPFDCVKEAAPEARDPKMEELGTPGIVARLMGLDTMPGFESASTSKDSIRKSRSAGYWAEFDHTDTEHRRVKSSSSFREVPSFFNQEDDEFLVLSFEGIKEKKPKKGCKEVRRRREGGAENKENTRVEPSIVKKISSPSREIGNSREEIKHSSRDSSHNKINHKKSHTSTNLKTPLEAKTKKKQEFRKYRCGVIEAEADQNSSPVSVLDLIEFVSEPESLLSEEDSRLKGSNSRRKLSTVLINPDQQSSDFSEIPITEEESKSVHPQVRKTSQEPNSHGEDYSDISKLGEAEVLTSNWITKEIPKMGEYEEIRNEFGLYILDHLLYELVSELL